MIIHDHSNEKVLDVRSKSTTELRELLFSLDMEMDIMGGTIMVSGDKPETKKMAEVIFKELRYRAGIDDRKFYNWITKAPEKEIVLPKSQCIHAYHSTHTFKFGGGFEVPYNINKGEAYNADGTILAYIDPSGYKNKSHIIPPLRSMTKAALKAKLIANGNHDAALHL